MIVGPVFSREVATAPRHWRLYFLRALYVGALFGLVVTAWLILLSSQPVRSLGDLARFGALAFALIAPVQLALAGAFSALLAAAAVAQEKDRRTFDLLLMTNLTNSELVVGKLLASMLSILMLILAGLPLLMMLTLLGGVSHGQVIKVFGVTLTTALAAGSLGSTISLWREKTFQSLAMTALALMLWLVAGEAVATGALGDAWLGTPTSRWADAISPLRAIVAASRPSLGNTPLLPTATWLGEPVQAYMLGSAAIALLLNLVAITRVRVWNPTQEATPRGDEESRHEAASGGALQHDVHSAPGRAREVWDNPILWREIRTWAYGKKVIVVRLAYAAIFAATALALNNVLADNAGASYRSILAAAAGPVVPLLILGMVLLNSLAVTSLTNERDAKALDLLLVTDLTPKEIVYGKLGGICYNAKELIALPALLFVVCWWFDKLSTENLLLILGAFAVLCAFVAMLGVHAGMTYANSRSAVGVSLGTLLFLLLGIGVCMRMMIAFQRSFDYQFMSFAAFMLGGSVALFIALGSRNPSPAIGWASLLLPFFTFYVISSFIQGNFGAAALVTIATYGFATAAMLIPALYEFDVATGRTTARDI